MAALGVGGLVRSWQELISMIRQLSASIQVGFEATGGQEWGLWTALVEAGIVSKQLPPAQIKAFAMSRGTRAKTDRIDAELISRFMACRPRAGRERPDENLRILRTLVARSGQLVDMRMRLKPRSGLERSRAFLPVSRA